MLTKKRILIEKLIDDDINTIIAGGEETYLYDILFNGFCGYNKYTLKQLKEEYKERNNENKIS